MDAIETFKSIVRKGTADDLREFLSTNPDFINTKVPWSYGSPKIHQSSPLDYVINAPFHKLTDHADPADFVGVLLAAGSKIGGYNPPGKDTPLHGAVSLSLPRIAEALLDAGADLETTSTYPGIPIGTPLDFAVHFGMEACVDLLVSRGAEIKNLRMAAGSGDLDETIHLLHDPSLTARDRIDGFRCAVLCGKEETAKVFINRGIDLHAEIDDATVLHHAAWHGSIKGVKLMIDFGASPAKKDPVHGSTPLGWAEYRLQLAGEQFTLKEVVAFLKPLTPTEP